MGNMDELKDKLFAAIDTICKDYEAKKPEFKVPGWYVFNKGKEDIIFYAISRSIAEGKLYETKDSWYIEIFCRPTTPQEIESHLRKICDEKYIGKEVRDLAWDNEIFVPLQFHEYESFCDKIWYTHDRGIIKLYGSGQFAEIIPEKKRLPKTREEFEKFYQDWEYSKYSVSPTGFNEFLNEYEE